MAKAVETLYVENFQNLQNLQKAAKATPQTRFLRVSNPPPPKARGGVLNRKGEFGNHLKC